MTDPTNFSEARERLEDIVKQVRSKDVSLEKSLDLFDEAIKMGNSCFEMIDRIDAGDAENTPRAEVAEPAGNDTETVEGTKSGDVETSEQQDDEDAPQGTESE